MVEKKDAARKARKDSGDVAGPMMDAFSNWLAYIKRNTVRYYVGLLKIGLTTLFAGWIVLMAVVAVGLALLIGAGVRLDAAGIVDDIAANATVFGIVIIYLLIGFMVLKWVERTIQLTAIIFTDAEFSGKRFSLIESALRICWPVLRLTLADMGLFILFLLPAVLLAAFGLAGGSAVAGTIALMFIVLYVGVMAMVYTFLTQFWFYGVVLEGRGVMDSLKRSVRIAKGNIMDVFVFDVVWMMGIVVFSIPLIIYSFISEIAGRIFEALMASGSLAMVGAYLLFVIVSAMISTVLTTIMEAFATPSHYLFWKNIRGP